MASTRRECLGLLAAAGLLRGQQQQQANQPPAPPVAIARCRTYGQELPATLSTMFDQLGGLSRLVANKTVTIKLNLTGSPSQRLQGKALGLTHYTHPATVEAMLHLMTSAGAKRIRLVESCWASSGPIEEYMLDAGWNVRRMQTVGRNIEFENTNAAGQRKDYVRLKVPGGGTIYPAYELNRAYDETDVFVSMAKLKNHETCGVTLSMKNCFGNTPASIYGDDAGLDEPNENPGRGRVDTCHLGKRQPAKAALPELDPASPRDPGYRMPRITADVVAARPIDIAFIDGIETVTGGEGPWVKGLRPVQPGLLILGTNGVTTDTVATSVMGYDPRASKGSAPFQKCDNTLVLAESLGLGSTDLRRIEVRGLPIQDARFAFPM